MKKLLITILVVVAILAAGTAGLFAWANATNHRFTVNTLATTRLTSKQMTLNQHPRNLKFNVRSAVVVVKAGHQDRLELTNVGASQYHVTQTDDTLTVSEPHATQSRFEIGHPATLTLTLKQPGDLNRVTIDQHNGTLKLNDLKTKHLNIHHHNGTTVAHDLTVTAGGQLVKDNGTTALHQLNTAGLQVAVKTGQFKLNGTKRASNGHRYVQAGAHPLIITSGSGQVVVTE